ncbi:MAG: SCP2 sterol-binding domain-containing protein [Xanthomonadales bacterium]|nr:SCP2 sterol-binding domain-containing protein [Xanthomonadales bacterium]
MTATPSPLGTMLTAGMNRLFDRLVDLDPASAERLAELEGRTLEVQLEGPGINLLLNVSDGRLRASIGGEAQPDASLKATPGGFLALAASGGETAVGRLKIEGDVDTARRFQELFAGLDPDWEEGMTRVFGDVIGFQAARLMGNGVAWLRQAGASLAESASEYVREESRQLVTRPEMEEFLDAVDDLRDDVAHLESRVQRLQEPDS